VLGTRGRILEAALSCFIDSGYEQTTITRIRERSGVSNGALFHHFPTKEAIADELHVDALASFQLGLWELLERRPRSIRAAVAGTISHQLHWIEANEDRARFLYRRGQLEWNSPASAQLQELNRGLAAAYREWMAPFLEAGEVRASSMVMLTAIVAGPAHAIAQRWLAGQLSSSLHAYLDELVDAACAGLSGTPARARRRRDLPARHARMRLELVCDDGEVLAGGEATAELLPVPGRTAA